jgi:hypothetical protein
LSIKIPLLDPVVSRYSLEFLNALEVEIWRMNAEVGLDHVVALDPVDEDRLVIRTD